MRTIKSRGEVKDVNFSHRRNVPGDDKPRYWILDGKVQGPDSLKMKKGCPVKEDRNFEAFLEIMDTDLKKRKGKERL